ncbi:hypothetical protein WJX72_004243 [[Myrmecia] bisecta]|uniref:Transposase n=1 Tax=[Myrmecia] bisecta TaxID=41462 RepID=A0AAW1P2M1_9CHLO
MASEVFIRQCHIDSDCQAGLQSLWCPTRIFSRAGGYALPAAALEQEELDARRIIESDAAIPPLDLSDNWPYTPAETRWILEKLSPEGLSLLRYNQTKKDRICPYCKTRFCGRGADVVWHMLKQVLQRNERTSSASAGTHLWARS